MPVVALAGGVGAARFLRGLVRCLPAEELTVIVNTGDDREFYGVHVSPDIDIIGYTLSGAVDKTRGYGLAGDTFDVIETLGRHGHETWFRLGDRDFALCLHRTLRLKSGIGLAEISDEIRCRLGVKARLLPMSEADCPTYVRLANEAEGADDASGRRVHFEEYLVRDGAQGEVRGVDLSAAEAAMPAPGVLEALAGADTVLVCPSNPVVSIAPILAVRGVKRALAEGRAPVVGVSPIIAGAPVKGPADRLLRGVGAEVSALGVARLYQSWMQGFIIDERDAALRAPIEALGMRCRAMDTLMKTDDVAEALARAALALAREIGPQAADAGDRA